MVLSFYFGDRRTDLGPSPAIACKVARLKSEYLRRFKLSRQS